MGCKSVRGSEPLVGHRLTFIMSRNLTHRCKCYEESSIKSAMYPNWGNPVGQVFEFTHVEEQAFSLHHLYESEITIVDLASILSHPTDSFRLFEAHRASLRVASHQETRLLVEFTQAGHEVGESPPLDP